jgi:pseudaminic acid cytidylyltransferase
MFFPEHQLTRSQDLPEAWHDAGQFYWGTAAAWSDSDGIFSDVTIGVPLPRHRVQHIDNEEDWVRAEHLYQIQRTDRD